MSTEEQEYNQFSLTNQIEIIKVETLYAAGQNQFDMIRTPTEETTIKVAVARFNIFSSTYNGHKVTSILKDKLKVSPVEFTDVIQGNSIYFFINNKITISKDRLEIRLFEIWRTIAGTTKMGSKYFPEDLIRFPYIMPSRGKEFR